MKKLFFNLLVLFAVTAGVQAQVTNEPNPMATTPATQPENNAYYWNYYPQQNVYYNETSKNYTYYDKANNKWATGTALATPYKPVTDADTRYKVTYKGSDVWKNNTTDKVKYKVKKNGTVKPKLKPSGN